VDFAFTSQQLTQNITMLAERVIRPAMVQIANQIDVSVMNLYKDIPQYVGTPGTLIQSFAGLPRARRTWTSVRSRRGRSAVLAPADFWALAGSQTALFSQAINNKSYREGEIGKIGGIDTYMSQNAPTFLTGPFGGTPAA
jgi:hypothetical protein